MADKLRLTVKQERLAQGLFAGLTQREAYKHAYDAENMTDKTIDEKACLLAGEDKIKARIDQLKEELKNRNMITVEKVLAELAKIAMVDLNDFLGYRTEKTVVGTDDETGEPIIDYAHVMHLKDSDQVDGTLISEVQLQKGNLKFKLHDRVKALELCGKHLGMFVDRTRLEGADGAPLSVQFGISRPKRGDKEKTDEE